MIKQSVDLFTEKHAELGKTKTIEMKIDMGDHLPNKLKLYQTPFTKWQVVSKAIDEMLAANIIHQFVSLVFSCSSGY